MKDWKDVTVFYRPKKKEILAHHIKIKRLLANAYSRKHFASKEM